MSEWQAKQIRIDEAEIKRWKAKYDKKQEVATAWKDRAEAAESKLVAPDGELWEVRANRVLANLSAAYAEIERLTRTLTEADQIYVLWRNRAEAAEAKLARVVEIVRFEIRLLPEERAVIMAAVKSSESSGSMKHFIRDCKFGEGHAGPCEPWAAAKASEQTRG